MTGLPVAAAADEAEYFALSAGDEDIAPTDKLGCGCVPVFHSDRGEATQPWRHVPSPPRDPFARQELQP